MRTPVASSFACMLVLLMAACAPSGGANSPAAQPVIHTTVSREPGTTTTAPAVEVAVRFNLSQDLDRSLTETLQSTDAFAAQVRAMGLDRAAHALRREMARTLPQYRQQWETSLARAFSQRLTAREIESLLRDGKRSPAYPKLQAIHADVSAEFVRQVRAGGQSGPLR